MPFLLAVALLLFSSEAIAQKKCWDREVLVEYLEQRWGETMQVWRLTREGRLAEMFMSWRGQTWTLLVTRPNGCTTIDGFGIFKEKTRPNPHIEGEVGG